MTQNRTCAVAAIFLALALLLGGCLPTLEVGDAASRVKTDLQEIALTLEEPASLSLPAGTDARFITLAGDRLLYQTVDDAGNHSWVCDAATSQPTELDLPGHWKAAPLVLAADRAVLTVADTQGAEPGVAFTEVDPRTGKIGASLFVATTVDELTLTPVSESAFSCVIHRRGNTWEGEWHLIDLSAGTDEIPLKAKFDEASNNGRQIFCARRVGDEFYVLQRNSAGLSLENRLTVHDLTGKATGELPLPADLADVYDAFTDIDRRGEQMAFYLQTTAPSYYTFRDGEYMPSAARYGWGALYPRDNADRVVYDQLAEGGGITVSDTAAGRLLRATVTAPGEANRPVRLVLDPTGQSTHAAVVCTADPHTASEEGGGQAAQTQPVYVFLFGLSKLIPA